MNRTSRPWSGCLPALLLTACATAPLELQAPDPGLAISVGPNDFPGAARLMAGFDHRSEQPFWQSGDQLLFGLRLQRGEEFRRWLLLLEVVVGDGMPRPAGADESFPKFELFEKRQWSYHAMVKGERRKIGVDSRTALVSVVVHDENAKPLGKSLVKLPAELMGKGLLPGIEAARAHQSQGGTFEEFESLEEVRPMAEGLIALIALLDVVQNDEVLEDYFWEVVQKPSIWSVIAGFGVRASLTASLEKSVPVQALPAPLPPTVKAFAMPLRVDVNDTAALVADVIAVDAQRPYALCGGIIAATARHPSIEDLTFGVQLLAARLGK
ncbi:MAG: hypothetical protein NXI31_21675 [bacterium]|nr:hypothetical protein [bacterium]